MFGVAHFKRMALVHLAPRLDQIHSIQQGIAVGALVAARIFIATLGACSFHKAIRQEFVTALAEYLLACLLNKVVALEAVKEDSLCNISLGPPLAILRGLVAGPSEIIKPDVKPVVDGLMLCMVLVANLHGTNGNR